MTMVNLNKLQFSDLSNSIVSKSAFVGLKLNNEQMEFLKSKTGEFLNDLKRLIITDRKKPKGDGYFVLEISKLLSSLTSQ